ncbi:hypothetical protein VTK73DRAFT_5232 [Phialemonium thermophilum]|uniref:Saccharopine dehydrogenase-like C-terminal domain-containing protein n=1 Tax=Phialemonium thermophilum TaxID=223376 RepID=A0ABR3V414_9PEZI
MQFEPGERDLVILQHKFEVELKDGTKQTRLSTLVEYGSTEPGGYSAMAKLGRSSSHPCLVSFPRPTLRLLTAGSRHPVCGGGAAGPRRHALREGRARASEQQDQRAPAEGAQGEVRHRVQGGDRLALGIDSKPSRKSWAEWHAGERERRVYRARSLRSNSQRIKARENKIEQARDILDGFLANAKRFGSRRTVEAFAGRDHGVPSRSCAAW